MKLPTMGQTIMCRIMSHPTSTVCSPKESFPVTIVSILQAVENMQEDPISARGVRTSSTKSRILYKRTSEDGGIRAVDIKLTAYSLYKLEMLRGEYYFVAGKLHMGENQGAPTLSCAPWSLTLVPGSVQLGISLANKAFVTAFGKVTEKIIHGTADTKTFATVTLEHCDYDMASGKSNYFTMKYLLASQSSVCKAHHLIQIGRTVVLSGLIYDWNNKTSEFVIDVGSVSLANTNHNINHDPTDPVEAITKLLIT